MNWKAIAIILTILMICPAFAEELTCEPGETTWYCFLDEQTRENLTNNPATVAAFEGTEMAVPYPVNEHTPEEAYFLIPFNKQGGTTGVIMIDGQDGHFKELAIEPEPQKYLPIEKEEALEKTRQELNPEPTQNLEIMFDYGEETADLRWQIGENSETPFRPYWFTTIGDGQWLVTQTGTLVQMQEFTGKKMTATVQEIDENPPQGGQFQTLGKYFSIESEEENYTFLADLVFSYPDEDQDGTIDGTAIQETSIKVYYKQEGGEWTNIGNAVVDTEANQATATVDHFTLFALMAPKPKPEPKPENPPGGGGGFTGGGGGGGTSVKLEITIDGNCTSQEIKVTTLNTYGNPTPGAKITVTKENKVIDEKTTSKEGTATFTLEEPGEYKFIATKNLYTVNSQTIQVQECIQEEPQPEETEEMQTDEQLFQEPLAQQGTQETTQKETTVNEEEEPITPQTGLITLNQNPTANATIAGLLAAIAAGALLHIKKKTGK